MGYVIKKLKERRLNKFLTQRELAKKAGLSSPTIVSAEAGVQVERQTVLKLATALGITPEELI